MKIAQVCLRYPPAQGGVETVVEQLATGLGRRGHAVQVITSPLADHRRGRPLPAAERRPAPGLARLPYVQPGPVPYPFLRGLDRALAAAAPQVVQAHSFWYQPAEAAAWSCRRRGVPFVFTPHYYPRPRPWWRLYRELARGGALAADAVVAVSRWERELIRREGLRPDRIRVIPHGIEPSLFPATGPDFFADYHRAGRRVLLFSARLDRGKGADTLLQAAHLLALARPDALFFVTGSDFGWGRRLAAAARGPLRDRLVLAGRFDRPRLIQAMRSADLFVLPSRYEAFGLALLEAMACGTPVVSCQTSAIPELVADGEDGRLVPPGDAAALAAAIGELLADDRRREEMGRRARAKALGRYTLDRCLDAHEALYRELLAVREAAGAGPVRATAGLLIPREKTAARESVYVNRWYLGSPARRHLAGKRVARVLDLADPAPGERVLDAGCGPGLSTLVAARRGARAVGLDRDRQKLAIGRDWAETNRVPAAFLAGDAGALPFADARFDLVLSLELVEHVPDWPAVLAELARALAPGGRLAVSTPNRWGLATLAKQAAKALGLIRLGGSYERFISEKAIGRCLAGLGLEPLAGRRCLFIPPFTPAWLMPLARLAERAGESLPLANRLATTSIQLWRRPGPAPEREGTSGTPGTEGARRRKAGPKRVALVSSFPRIGGAQVGMLQLLDGLDRRRVDYAVFAPESGPFAAAVAARGFAVAPLGLPESVLALSRRRRATLATLAGLARFLPAAVALSGRLRAARVRLVHTQDLKSHLLGGLAARLAGIPVLWHLRDLLAPGALGLFRAAARLTGARTVAISRAVQAQWPGAALVYNGTAWPAKASAFAEASADQSAPKEFTAIAIGALCPGKGQAVLLRAWARLKESRPRDRLLLVGEAAYAPERESGYGEKLRRLAASLGIADRVTFTGFVADPAPLLARADLLVHPAVGPEAFGRVLIEAQVRGLPVVASAGGGVPEIVEDNVSGRLVPPGDDAALAAAIGELAGDEARRRRLGEAGRARARERFSLAGYLTGVAALYGDTL